MEFRKDPSGFEVRLDDALIARMAAPGGWCDRTLADHARERMREDPEALLLVDNDRPLSRRVIFDKAVALVAALRRRGLGRGDVISFQLPSWHEAAVVHLAAALGGFVSGPIVHIYRGAEVGFILADSRAKAIFVPARFGNFDYAAMIAALADRLPDLAVRVTVRGERAGFEGFDALIAEQADAADEVLAIDPNDVKLVMYTSGTTGRAKGVLHSHNTVMAEIDHYGRIWGVGPEDRVFMASPLSHIAGLGWAVEVPWVLGASAVIVDRWSGEEAVALMAQHRCTVTAGATVFLQETVAAARRLGASLPDLRMFSCGGATVPPSVIREAWVQLPNCIAMRVYGSTEASSVTYGVRRNAADLEHAATTDGQIVDWEVKIVDPESARPLPPGSEGELLVRGRELCLGYARREDTLAAFDEAGFFRTGDIGRIVDGDYLVITDRKKDLVIRGGENLSSKEIEDALAPMPGIGAVAVVAMPCARLGEAVCVFIEQTRERAALDVKETSAFLEGTGLSRRKFPERVVVIELLPRNPAGKILKTKLRQIAADLVKAEADRTRPEGAMPAPNGDGAAQGNPTSRPPTEAG